MAKAKVAMLRTSPKTVLGDYRRVLNLADYHAALPKDADTALKVSLSWSTFFPGASTTPWQLDGVVRAMKKDGWSGDLIHACYHRSAVIDAHQGERDNKLIDVVRAHGLRNVHLYEDAERVDVRDALGDHYRELHVLPRVYPRGFSIPRRLLGQNVLHLPTIKTHAFLGVAGAMESTLGSLLDERRHWTHPVMHEALVDLLVIQQHVHRGSFAVMDGTFVGDGPGPRCIVPRIKNVLLASADPVALDAVASKLMGMEPLRDVRALRLAHERGLGCADLREIEVAGDAYILDEQWRFEGPLAHPTLATRGAQQIHFGALKAPLEWSLRTWLAPWAYVASVAYHDAYWYPAHAGTHMQAVLDSEWGRLFSNWGHAKPDADSRGFPEVGIESPDFSRSRARQMLDALRLLGKAVVHAPEWHRPRVRSLTP